MVNAQFARLSNGLEIPKIGIGSWQEEADVEEAMLEAIDSGFRLFESSPQYEEIIGGVLSKYIASGNMTREELFLSMKMSSSYHHIGLQLSQLQESLKRLNTSYVDLLLVEQPPSNQVDNMPRDHSATVEHIWRGLEALYGLGLAKAIGICNWSVGEMERVRAIASVPIHVAQVECHIYRPQLELIAYCEKHKIIVISDGFIGSPAIPIPFLHKVIDFFDYPNMFAEPVVVEIADKHKKTPAQVLLHYLLDRYIGVIYNSLSPDRMNENLDVSKSLLIHEDITRLNAIPYSMQPHFGSGDYSQASLSDRSLYVRSGSGGSSSSSGAPSSDGSLSDIPGFRSGIGDISLVRVPINLPLAGKENSSSNESLNGKTELESGSSDSLSKEKSGSDSDSQTREHSSSDEHSNNKSGGDLLPVEGNPSSNAQRQRMNNRENRDIFY